MNTFFVIAVGMLAGCVVWCIIMVRSLELHVTILHYKRVIPLADRVKELERVVQSLRNGTLAPFTPDRGQDGP